MNTDSLGLIVSIIILHTHEMRVCLLIEAGASRQDVLVGLVHGFHHLQSKRRISFLSYSTKNGLFGGTWHNSFTFKDKTILLFIIGTKEL